MTTGIRLHPVAAQSLKELKTALERDWKLDVSERRIMFAVIHGVTAPQVIGMLNAFTAAETAWKDAQAAAASEDDGE